MKQSYDFNIKQIKNLSVEEMNSRQKNLDLFYKSGFPSKKAEDWKFTDLNLILNKNFEKISNKVDFESNEELEIIKNFEHNYILLNNGKIISTSFAYEEKNKILIKDFEQKESINLEPNNTLALLNNALSSGGFSLEINKNYKAMHPDYLDINIKKEENNNKIIYGDGVGGFYGFCLHIIENNFKDFIKYNHVILNKVEKSCFHDEGIILGYLKIKEEYIAYLNHIGCYFINMKEPDALWKSNLCKQARKRNL